MKPRMASSLCADATSIICIIPVLKYIHKNVGIETLQLASCLIPCDCDPDLDTGVKERQLLLLYEVINNKLQMHQMC